MFNTRFCLRAIDPDTHRAVMLTPPVSRWRLISRWHQKRLLEETHVDLTEPTAHPTRVYQVVRCRYHDGGYLSPWTRTLFNVCFPELGKAVIR